MSDSINIVGLDPGNNLGVSILSVDSTTLDIISISTKTYVLEKYVSSTDNIMLDKWIVLENIIRYISETYQPYVVGMEAAFLNLKYPKAIINLGSYTTVIELSLNRYNRYIKLFKYAPKYVKKIVGCGDADKLAMLNFMTSIPEIKQVVNLYGRTEHEIDATAIAYTVLKEVRQYPYILYSI